MAPTADKLFHFLSARDHERIQELAAAEIGATSYSDFDGDQSPESLLVCEYVDRRFSSLSRSYSATDIVDLDRCFHIGWLEAITDAIESEVTFASCKDDDETATVGELLEHTEFEVEALENKTKRSVALGEITSIDRRQLRQLEGRQACLVHICDHWQDDIDMVATLREFAIESESSKDKSGRWRGFKFEVRERKLSEFEIAKIAHKEATKKMREDLTAGDELYSIPGFVDRVVEMNMASAQYPNRKLAFAGALTLLASIVGRRVKFRNLAPNIYMLCLASSGTGKDFGRQVNTAIASACGLQATIAESVSSGEGLEDLVATNHSMLLQLDEFSHLIRSIANDKDGKQSAIVERLLRLFTASASTYYTRAKANTQPTAIVRPSLSILATCTPSDFADACNTALLRNGLISRMVLIDGIKRGRANRDSKPLKVPDEIVEDVKHLLSIGSGTGNLGAIHPDATELAIDKDADDLLATYRDQADATYEGFESNLNEAAMAIIARAGEQATKLAMLHAVSSDPFSLRIRAASVEWATRFVDHHVGKLLALAASAIGESDFDRATMRVLERVAASPDGISHSDLLRFCRMRGDEFRKLVATMIERGDLVQRDTTTGGRPCRVYFLAN